MRPWSRRFSAIGRKYSLCRLTVAAAARVPKNATNNLGLIKPAWAGAMPDATRQPAGAVSAIAALGTHHLTETSLDTGREGNPPHQNHPFDYCSADMRLRHYGSRCCHQAATL